MAADRAQFVHVPTLGIDVLRAEFADHAYERHAHDAYVFLALERGGIRFRYRGSRVEMGERRLMVLDPEQAHDGEPRDRCGFVKSALYVPRAVVVEHLGPDCGERFVAPVFDDLASVDAIARLARRLVSRPPDAEADAAFTAILARLFGRFGGGVREPEPRAPALDRVRTNLHERSSEDVRLADLCAVAGMTGFHLTRAFRTRFGLPPHAYLTRLRLEHARALLARGEALARVSATAGFGDQSHFSRRFRGAYGITPGAYRAARTSNT